LAESILPRLYYCLEFSQRDKITIKLSINAKQTGSFQPLWQRYFTSIVIYLVKTQELALTACKILF